MHLKNLLRMKALRLERSEHSARRQEVQLRAADQAHLSSVQEHHQYRRWRIQEESRLFDIYKTQLLDCTKLEQWKLTVALLREKEAYLEQVIARRVQILVEARETLQLCRQQLKESQRQVEKVSQLQQRLFAEKRLQAECNEEEEHDEFRNQEAFTE